MTRRSLLRDTRGATILEFAFVCPVMIMMLMGLFDLLYQSYAQAILNGEVQKAARDSGIEGGAANTSAIDAKVIGRMNPIMKNLTQQCATGTYPTAVWCSTRKSYDNFTAVAPEPFTDGNGNGIRDAGECYTDLNGNKSWDADPGAAGQGGASAVTLYTVTITYPHLFPVTKLLGFSDRTTIASTTLLKNQPYATQTTNTVTTECT